jgi:hypothetical protein
VWAGGSRASRSCASRSGPADELLAEPGVETFLLHVPETGWCVHTLASRAATDGRPLGADVIGRPALLSSGSVVALTPRGLEWRRVGNVIVPGGEQALLCTRDMLPDDVALEGTIGGKDALLSSPYQDGRRLFLVPGSPLTKPALYPVADREGQALVPAGAPLILARAARALAFLGQDGWEAWTLSDTGLAERAVAAGYTKPGAIFTPDGRSLIFPGKVDGIFPAHARRRKVNLMCGGNIGVSERVAPELGLPHRTRCALVTPPWDLDGWMQIAHSPRPRGPRATSRWAATTLWCGHVPGRRTLAYVQATSTRRPTSPSSRTSTCSTSSASRRAPRQIDSRDGGRPLQGPCFIGEHSALAYLAGGEAIRIESRRNTPAPAGNFTGIDGPACRSRSRSP